jgi:hypothetical protein
LRKTNTSVRPSRAGDQFHYLWAARRCLRLLSPKYGLTAVTIEGASRSEMANFQIEEGEEVIDIGEYYGSTSLELATKVHYLQLKHSTNRQAEHWTMSGLEKTLKGFAKRSKALKKSLKTSQLKNKIQFSFVTNRPIGLDVVEAFSDIQSNTSPRHPKIQEKIQKIVGMKGANLKDFCLSFHFEDKQDDYWDQRNILVREVASFLPGNDSEAPILLKELINRKALPESESDPSITKIDVLRVLGTDENSLFPARSLITKPSKQVDWDQENDLINEVLRANGKPVIFHADGGVGKTVFAKRIGRILPLGSVSILYDCFGDGLYRNISSFRHRPKDALVQISNDLAGLGLCYPLIPNSSAEGSEYFRAFISRLKQSINILQARNSKALLVLVIDAADNAQTAAIEFGDKRSFILDLIRTKLPDGVQLVITCRTHRQQLLEPPIECISIQLPSFSLADTTKFVSSFFQNASTDDIAEFHRLTLGNPRVQSFILTSCESMLEALKYLGPSPMNVDDTIKKLLEEKIKRLKDRVGTLEKGQIDLICSGLAILRPLIPISVLSAMSGVEEGAIKSFAYDIGKPVKVTDKTIQFNDEPSETWFRDTFRPDEKALSAFIDKIKHLTNTSSYVASILPQLLLEAKRLDEVVSLSLSAKGLPESSPIEKRDIELQRLQFALKATLRDQKYLDATKLSLKAGGVKVGAKRHSILIQTNTDLAAKFLETDLIQELVTRRMIGSQWMGSHYVYEAGLMSHRNELLPEARSHMRMANEWLKNWSKLPDEERKDSQVSIEDIAELAIADFHINGPVGCAKSLRSWRPRDISFRAGKILAERFINHGRFQDLADLAASAGNDIGLVLAINFEFHKVNRKLPTEVVLKVLKILLLPSFKIEFRGHWNENEEVLKVVTALAESAFPEASISDLKLLLTKYLPEVLPRHLSVSHSRSGGTYLRAYALNLLMSDQDLDFIELAHTDLRKEIEKHSSHLSQEAREFKEQIGVLWPWYKLLIKTKLNKVSKTETASTLDGLKSSASDRHNNGYRREVAVLNEIALIWSEILCHDLAVDVFEFKKLDDWITETNLNANVVIGISSRIAHVKNYTSFSLSLAARAYAIVKDSRQEADMIANNYVEIARAILCVSDDEAKAYFSQAVEVADKIGDENFNRWAAVLDIADVAGDIHNPNPELAYKLARCGELTKGYIERDKHFIWADTVDSITNLCPNSALALFSRWRDRGFGSMWRLTPLLLSSLLEKKRIDPIVTLSFIGFKNSLSVTTLLESALSKSISAEEREVLASYAFRYLVIKEEGAQEIGKFGDLLHRYKIALKGLDERVNFNKKEHVEEADYTVDDIEGSEELLIAFENINVCVLADLIKVKERLDSIKQNYRRVNFFEAIIKRVPSGEEIKFIQAFSEVQEFDLYDLRSFLEKIPAKWDARIAIKGALASLVKNISRRCCLDFSINRFYQILPLELIKEKTGVSRETLIGEVLNALGDITSHFSSDRLFSLVSILVVKLSQEQAVDTLKFALNLYDDMLDENDGDGPWSEELRPPTNINHSVAGVIWGCLTDPRISIRWEASHVILNLCRFNQREVLDSLVSIARGESTYLPFVDKRMYYYKLHGLQWLVMAFARASKTNPSPILQYTDFLVEHSLNSEPHVMIRHYASLAAINLLTTTNQAGDEKLLQQLRSVNVSRLDPVFSERYSRVRRTRYDPHEDFESRFFFGFDTEEYLFEPLGRCFAKTGRFVEKEVALVIKENLSYPGQCKAEEDERSQRGIFSDRNSYSRGSHPKEDDLRFYLTYHALMITSGKMLSSLPTHRDSDYKDDDFSSWVSEQSVLLNDGMWLSDRRDPAPLERPRWKDEQKIDFWKYSLRKDDFERVFLSSDDFLNVWGRWRYVANDYVESIEINSVLVHPSKSEALLSALQTADNPRDYSIPAYKEENGDDEDEENYSTGDGKEELLMKGWIVDNTEEKGLCALDPWSGGISYPAIVPAPYVIETMFLSSSTDNRYWYFGEVSLNQVAIESQLWGLKDDEDSERENGRRLRASSKFMLQFLSKTGMDLLVEVEMNRRLKYSRYRKDDNEGYTPPSAKIFLVKADGTIRTV